MRYKKLHLSFISDKTRLIERSVWSAVSHSDYFSHVWSRMNLNYAPLDAVRDAVVMHIRHNSTTHNEKKNLSA